MFVFSVISILPTKFETINMLKILKAEKFPYFLTVLFTIIVIQFNYTIDSIFKTPIIEYSYIKTNIKNEEGLFQKILLIKNISTDKSIESFHLQLRYRSRSKIILKYPDIDPIPPATIIQKDPQYTQDKLLYYPIQIIQPEMSYELKFYTDEINENPFLFFNCSQPIRLKEKSLYTWFLRNHILLNLVFMLLFFIISIIYLLKLSKS